MTDSNIGLIDNKYNKDQETDQTAYRDDTTTRIVDYLRDDFKRVPEEADIKPENSFISNEINTGRPESSFEETTPINLDSNENVVSSTPEDTTLVSMTLLSIRTLI